MKEEHKKIVFAVSLILFVLVLVILGWFVGVPLIRLMEEPEKFHLWVDGSGVLGRIIFLGIVVFQVLVAFVPGEPVELAAGYIFGFWEGTVLTMAGFLIGSWIVFELVRKYGVKLVEVFFLKEKIQEVSFLKDPRRTKALALVLMTIPGTPKDFLSYFAGLTNLKLGQWLLIVGISRIPSLVTSTATGAAAGQEHYLLSGAMLAITALLSAAGIYHYRKICKQENTQ